MNIKAATLNEILVVMILTGVTSFIVFEGLSLYQRMYVHAITHNHQSVDLYDNYIRVQALFANADSICEHEWKFKIFRQNELAGNLWLHDSILVFQPQDISAIDTLIKGVSAYKIVVSDNGHAGCIDSLILFKGEVALKFGIDIQPDRLALINNIYLEDNFENYENR